MATARYGHNTVGALERNAIMFGIEHVLRQKGCRFKCKPYVKIIVRTSEDPAHWDRRIEAQMILNCPGKEELRQEHWDSYKQDCMHDVTQRFLHECVDKFAPVLIMLDDSYAPNNISSHHHVFDKLSGPVSLPDGGLPYGGK